MDSRWERVQPYIEIDKNIAEKMMEVIKPKGTIKSISLIRNGLRNSNYCVEYDNKKFLIRIYGVEDNWWKKEEVIYHYIKEKVKAPELFWLDGNLDIIDKPYAIFEYVEGLNLDQYSKQAGYKKKVFSDIGHNLAWLHSTSYKEVGFFDDNLEVAEKLPELRLWYPMFLGEHSMRKLGEELTEAVRKYIEANDKNIERIEKDITLVHNDFRPINIMVDKQDTPYFIDWEGAMAGHSLGDIGEFLRIEEQVSREEENVFIQSYNEAANKRLPEDYKELAKLRDLVNLLQLLNSRRNLEIKDGDLVELIKITCCKAAPKK